MNARPPHPPLTLKQQALAARHRGLVPKRAARLAARYAGLIDEADLIGLGDTGLVDAAGSYREELGGFDDYARRRIDGAMLDGIRPRARQARIRRAAERAGTVLLAAQRDDFNSADHQGDDIAGRLDTFADDAAAAVFVAMTEEAQRSGEDEMATRLDYARAKAALAEAKARLPKEQRALVDLVYRDEAKQTEAAERFGVSYNTIQRWHEKAIRHLRKLLVPRDGGRR